VTGSTTALNQDVRELLNLLLGTTEGTQALLSQLTGTLVLVVLQQLHAALLVGGKADDLTDQVTDEFDTLAEGLKKKGSAPVYNKNSCREEIRPFSLWTKPIANNIV